MSNEYDDYLVIYNISLDANILDIVNIFERFGAIEHIQLIGRCSHVGRCFIKFVNKNCTESCYNAFNGPNPCIIQLNGQDLYVCYVHEKESRVYKSNITDPRNRSLLYIGQNENSEFSIDETKIRNAIIEERKRTFFSDNNVYVSKKCLVIYNCPRRLNYSMLKKLVRESVLKYARMKESNIDESKVRILSIEGKFDERRVIKFSKHIYASYALLHLNGNFDYMDRNITPIVMFDIRKKHKESEESVHPLFSYIKSKSEALNDRFLD